MWQNSKIYCLICCLICCLIYCLIYFIKCPNQHSKLWFHDNKSKIIANVFVCVYLFMCNFQLSVAIKAGFYTCVSRKRNSARCLSKYRHQCSQAIPAFAKKASMLATKVAHIELFLARRSSAAM